MLSVSRKKCPLSKEDIFTLDHKTPDKEKLLKIKKIPFLKQIF
jgi:hypothetical protein